MRITSWLRKILRSTGFDVVRYAAAVDSEPPDILRYIMAGELARVGKDFYFVQIGANDGVMADPLRQHILSHHLRGLLVEPLPDLFQRLQRNYANEPQLAFEQCAISERDGEMPLFRVRPGAPVPAWAHGLASFSRGHLTGARFQLDGLDDHIEEVSVRTMTLASLLAKHGVQHVSLLQIDTEGYDCTLVRQALRGGLRPDVIHYERIHAPFAERSQCVHDLIDAGYNVVDIGRDTLAIREQLPL